MSGISEYSASIKALETSCGYIFQNKRIAFQALSHSSFANEYSQKFNCEHKSNERLEFLGDSVLSLVVSYELFEDFINVPEGDLSKMRASLVCEASLAECAKDMKLDEIVLLGSGENSNGGRQRASILSDCFEAVIGAIYIDGGLEAARKFVLSRMSDSIKNSSDKLYNFDYKTTLQEMLQKEEHSMPKYQIINVEGPDHNKKFTIKVVSDTKFGVGVGKSKKEAEQNAAKDFIDKGYF